nr:uncharacterized protein LOC129270850 [Lytechinus pictus]
MCYTCRCPYLSKIGLYIFIRGYTVDDLDIEASSISARIDLMLTNNYTSLNTIVGCLMPQSQRLDGSCKGPGLHITIHAVLTAENGTEFHQEVMAGQVDRRMLLGKHPHECYFGEVRSDDIVDCQI